MAYMGRSCPEDIFCMLHFVVLIFMYDQPREQDHGVRPLPTAEYPDLKQGVTLKCTRKQEAVSD